MAKVIQCDRCKKIVTDANVDKMRRLKLFSIKTTFADNTTLETIDICEDCFNLVKQVIDNGCK